MKRRRTGALIIGMVYMVLLVVAPPALAQNAGESGTATGDQERKEREWTGWLANGSLITRADLDEILRRRRLWAETNYENGYPGVLSGADLRGTNFFRAVLTGTDLSGADLRKVNLLAANLSGANLAGADLPGLSSAGLGWSLLI